MKKIMFLLLAILLYIPTQAQTELKLDRFDEIMLSGNVEVTLKKGEESKVYIDGDAYDDDEISVFVKSGELRINALKTLIKDDMTVRVTVVYDNLYKVHAQAGAQARFGNVYTGQQIKLRAASGARIEAKVDVEQVYANVTEGAVVELEGNTEDLDVKSHTGAQLFAYDLKAENVEAKTTTGGEAYVYASERIDATANTGGYIEYAGKPNIRNKNSGIAGSIHAANKGKIHRKD